MKKILISILILTSAIGCDRSTKFTDGKFYNELEECKKDALRLYDRFEKVSLEDYRNDPRSYLEKSCQVFDLLDLLNQVEKNQPIILYFNGFGCQRCIDMEQQVLNNPKIYKRLKSDFLFIPLTSDDRTLLPEDKYLMFREDCDYFDSKREIKWISIVNVNLQLHLLQAGSQPYFYAFDVNSDLGTSGYVNSVEEFGAFLDGLK